MSCFNLLDRSAWPAQSHLTWIFIPASKYKTFFFLDKVSSSWNRNLSLFPCHASSISLSYFVFNLPVYHSLSHTLCTSLAKKNKKHWTCNHPWEEAGICLYDVTEEKWQLIKGICFFGVPASSQLNTSQTYGQVEKLNVFSHPQKTTHVHFWLFNSSIFSPFCPQVEHESSLSAIRS